MNTLLLPVMLLVAGCSASSNSAQDSSSLGKYPVPIVAVRTSLPRTYWPFDYTLQRSQVTLPKPLHYDIIVITRCLNDSAVVNPVTLDTGPGLDVAHNYESEISIARSKQTWQKAYLTKTLFLNNSVVQKLGPLSTLSLSRTAFLRYKKPAFYFNTRLGVPDSDLFVEAEIALIPGHNLRVTNIREYIEAE